MVRNILLLLTVATAFTACCYRRPTSAQSDRFETKRPRVPVIECYECGDLTHRSEMFLFSEAWGTSNKWMLGAEYGYNFSQSRVFADAGIHYWPSRTMGWAYREQIGFVPFNPNWQLHPEIGMGLHQRLYRNEIVIQTPTGDQIVRKTPDYFWQTFAGVRYSIRYSNAVIGIRSYRLQNFETRGADWNFGIQLSFRL